MELRLNKLNNFFSLIKVSHTIFSLPFAVIGFVIATFKDGFVFNYINILLIVCCLFFARTSAMAYNRLVDKKIDKKNKRTKYREIPSKKINSTSVKTIIIISSTLFCLFSFFINKICFYLSFPVLGIILFYSHTKYFTYLCHLVLGLGLGLTPIAAYISVSSSVSWEVLVLGTSVMFWVAGFDIIYALQDFNFDKKNNLYSIPSYFGEKKAIYISRILHITSIVILFFINHLFNYNYFHLGGVILFSVFIFYQHFVFYKQGLKKINLIFFTSNGVASIILCIIWILDIFIF